MDVDGAEVGIIKMFCRYLDSQLNFIFQSWKNQDGILVEMNYMIRSYTSSYC